MALTLSDELAVRGQSLLAASGRILLAAHSWARPHPEQLVGVTCYG